MLNPSVPPMSLPLEEERLAALRSYRILDTPAAPAFDRLTELAARLCAVPFAGINFLDSDRVWFKSTFGLPLTALPRFGSFCDCAVALGGVLVSEDAARDPRFRENPLVAGPPGLRFYAGVPLRTPDGHAIGALCLADFVPRDFPAESRAFLTTLAAFVMRELELHQALSQREAEPALRVSEAPALYEPVPTQAQDLPPFYSRLQRAYHDLEVWAGQRTAALERANHALQYEVAERERAEAALQDAQAALEDRVAQRTAALERANQELRAQAAERREAEKRLAESRERYRSLFEQNQDAVYSFNREGRFLSANAACEGLSGYSAQELLQMGFRGLIVPEHLGRADAMFQKALRGEAQHDEVAITHRDGRRVEISVSKMPIVIGGEIVGAFGISRDVTARREMERERERLLAEALERAEHDPLTGLLNHRAFHKRFQDALTLAQESEQPLTVVLVDVKDFRFFNDAYGHIAGDDVLRRVAEALRETAPTEDGTTLARYAGDEFALLLPSDQLAEADARALAARLAALDYVPPGDADVIPLSLAMGVAYFPDDGVNRLDILSAAEARLRRAKAGEDGQAERLRTALTRSVEGFSMLDALVTAVDNKDRYTRRHSEDVLTYSLQIAEHLGLAEKTQRHLQTAALLHDVGKIGVPDAVLRKPGRLTDAEFETVRQHPMMGSVIVSAVPGFEATLDAIRHHHERWDGKGYPFGLAGEAIPFLARLMAVADAYSAMTTDRPYRKGLNAHVALSVLERGAGTQWDPQCVQAFVQVRWAQACEEMPAPAASPEDFSCRSRADCAS